MFPKYVMICLLCLLGEGLMAQKKSATDTLVLATYTYATNTRLANLQPLAAYLSADSRFHFVAVSYPTVPALIEAIVQGRVDIAMMNTAGYLVLQHDHPNSAIPMVNLEMGNDSVTNYGGCLVAAKSSGITKLEDLKRPNQQHTLALVKQSSTSGNLVPRLLLNSIGIGMAENSFTTNYAGTHQKALEAVLTGKAQLAGCGCAEVDSVKARLAFDDKAVVIASFNDIPLGPVVYRVSLPPGIVALVESQLLQVSTTNTSVFRNLCDGWTEFKQALSFVKVSDGDYDNFRKMFGNNESLWQMIR